MVEPCSWAAMVEVVEVLEARGRWGHPNIVLTTLVPTKKWSMMPWSRSKLQFVKDVCQY